MRWTRLLREAAVGLWRLFVPMRCLACRLRTDERHPALCPCCHALVPFTDDAICSVRMERMFWGQFPVGRVFALMYYQPDTLAPTLIHRIKYYQDADAGCRLAQQLLVTLAKTTFFKGIDAIVPIPLNQQRERVRSFNQSLSIAQGVAALTQLPVWHTVVERHSNNPSQTQVSALERRHNVEGVFRVLAAEQLLGKHLLIVDDVMTTGSTISSCARALVAAGAVRISVLTLAVSVKLPFPHIAYTEAARSLAKG